MVQKKQKILIIGHFDGRGGAQTAFRRLHEFIISSGYPADVILITDDSSGKVSCNQQLPLVRITHRAHGFRLKIFKWFQLFSAGMKARSYKPDVFITVGLSNSANFVAQWLDVHCYKIAQDFIANRDTNDPMWVSSLRVFDGVVVQSPSMLSYWINENRWTGKLNWLPCFPELPIRGVIRQRGAIDDKRIRIAFFGRLAANKGLPLLLTAMSAPGIALSVTLDLWGRGDEEQALRSFVEKLNLTHRVTLKGAYPEGEAGARLMASYDGLALTSTAMEGLPLVLLEAMAYGVPFLVTDVGAIRDCCHNNPDSILVEPTQEAINAGLVDFTRRIAIDDFDTERETRYYRQNFSYDVMASRWRLCFENPKRFFNEIQ